MRTLEDIDQVSDLELVRLYIAGNGSVGLRVALATELFGTNLTDNTMVVNHGKVLAANSDNDTDLVRRSSATEHDEIIKLVPSQSVLTRRNFRRFS